MKRLPVTDYPFLADQELLAEDWLSEIDKKNWDNFPNQKT